MLGSNAIVELVIDVCMIGGELGTHRSLHRTAKNTKRKSATGVRYQAKGVALVENGVQVETAIETLERCRARSAEREGAEAAGQRVHEIRREHLAAERKGADARRNHDRPAVEIVVLLDGFSGMQPRANSYRQTSEALGDSISHDEARAQGKRGGGKREHEAVALRFHHEPAMFLSGIAHDAVVPGEQAQELGVAESLEQHRR